jgi:hypothetical protein
MSATRGLTVRTRRVKFALGLVKHSKEMRMSRRVLMRSFVGLVVAAMLAVLAAMPALAYGSSDQWQSGFAGTFITPNGAFGFWGWCAFGGSNGSSAVGTTGTTADCQIENYFFSTRLGEPLNPFQATIDASSWTIATGSAFLPPGVPGFFLTGGTAEVVGPGAQILSFLFGVPVGTPFSLSTVCNPAHLAGSPCDTGIPAVPGHFGFTGQGFEIQIQVTKVS